MPLLHRHAYVALLIAPLAACLAVPAKGATPAGTLQRNLPGSFRWSSTGSVISPQQDGSAIGSDGNRYYRSFTSHAVSGSWRPPAATEANSSPAQPTSRSPAAPGRRTSATVS